MTYLIPNDAFNDFYRKIVYSIYGIGLSQNDSSVIPLNIPIKRPITPQWEEFENSISSILSRETLPDTYILIHIIDVIKPTNYYVIVNLYDKIKNKLGKKNIKTIISLKDEDNTLSVIKHLSNTKTIFKIGVSEDYVLLNEDGEYTYSASEKKSIPGFKNYIGYTKLSYEDRLKLKLIRKIGHFIKEKDEKHISCQKYFYDGVHCEKEIIHFLYEQIIDKIDKNKFFGVYFQCNNLINNWASSCFLNIYEKLKKNFGELCSEKILTDESDNVEQVILLMDVVTETTFRKKINNIKTKSKIIPFSIIYCDNNFDANKDEDEDKVKGEVSISNSNTDIQLNYLLKRKQQIEYIGTGKCIMCGKDLDIVKKCFYDSDSSPTLSSFEMWSMVIESGLKEEIISPEEHKTDTKRFKTLIPNTLDIVRYNGAYMASKFDILLKSNGLDFPKSGFIAYPDETNNTFTHYKNLTADKIPSNLFVSSLRLIYGYNILPIPRKLINKIKEDSSYLDEIKIEYKDFYNLLLETKNEAIIIVDEFPRTYNTYEAMINILSIEEKSPIAYVSLFNFSPDLAEEKIKSPIKNINLYEFQLD
jgi:hypothetical protein